MLTTRILGDIIEIGKKDLPSILTKKQYKGEQNESF